MDLYICEDFVTASSKRVVKIVVKSLLPWLILYVLAVTLPSQYFYTAAVTQ